MVCDSSRETGFICVDEHLQTVRKSTPVSVLPVDKGVCGRGVRPSPDFKVGTWIPI